MPKYVKCVGSECWRFFFFAVAEIMWVKLRKRIPDNENICADGFLSWCSEGRSHKDMRIYERGRDF